MQSLEKAENTPNPYDYYESILRRLISQFKDVEKSEEAAHQACIKALNFSHRYKKHKGGYYTWLYKIAFYSYLDILRKEKNHQKYLRSLPPSIGVTNETPETLLFKKQNKEIVNNFLQHLSKLEKKVISLRYVYDYKNYEIAEILNYPPSYIAYIICKAKKKIKLLCNKKK